MAYLRKGDQTGQPTISYQIHDGYGSRVHEEKNATLLEGLTNALRVAYDKFDIKITQVFALGLKKDLAERKRTK